MMKAKATTADSQVGLTIKTVAERTGVSVYTLRAWERRYGVPFPNRGADNRYRLYDEQDIADVLFIKQHVGTGIAPAQASALLRQRKERAPQSPASNLPAENIRATLIDAFVQSDQNGARRILDEAFALFTSEQVAVDILAPTMRAIGDKWLRAEITVWQEHLASNIVQQKLVAVFQAQPVSPVTAPHVVAACAPREEHVLGLLMFALLVRRQNWRVTFLGQGVPLNDVVDVARESKPNAVVVSVTTVIGLAEMIPWLDPRNRPAVRLAFGGRVLDRLPTLREHLPGAYIGEDLSAAAQNLLALKARDDYWSPSKRIVGIVNALRGQRLKIAGETVAQFMATLSPQSHRPWDAGDLNDATLFLVDALACALAYDAHELIDFQNDWLKAAMPPRHVRAEWIRKHLAIFARVLEKTLGKESNRLYQPLVERMKV